VQSPSVQVASHSRVPAVPQIVVHVRISPCTQPNPSSAVPLQSSSAPLQISAGAAHTLQVHAAPQVRAPVLPQVVVHTPGSPTAHANPSSTVPSQSSSRPLHTSGAPGRMAGSESSQSSAATPPTSGQSTSPCPSMSASRVA
jgi:hypothetical protein